MNMNLLGGNIRGQKDADNLSSYLNNQPDMLTAILKHRTEFKGQTGDIFLLPLPKTLDKIVLAVHPPPSNDPVQVEIPMKPKMQDFRDFRPRVLGWRDEAFKHYKVPERPPIKYFVYPSFFPYTALIISAMAALLFAIYGKGFAADWWRSKIDKIFNGLIIIDIAKWFMVVMHISEAGYMAWAVGRYQVPFKHAVKWVVGTLLLGFAVINEFWECMQYERLRVIYRQTDVGEIPPKSSDEASKPAVKASEKKKQ